MSKPKTGVSSKQAILAETCHRDPSACQAGSRHESEAGITIRQCAECGKEFETRRGRGYSRALYCSKSCMRERSRKDRLAKRRAAEGAMQCVECGKEFERRGPGRKPLFCSASCLSERNRKFKAAKDREETAPVVAAMSEDYVHDRDSLKVLAKNLGRTLSTLTVTRNDPFTAETPARRAAAEWFAEIWDRFDIQPGAHLRRIHYMLVSQDPPVLMVDGEPYINTVLCAQTLNVASLDARFLGLVPATSLVDRRNAEPVINLDEDEEEDAVIWPVGAVLEAHAPTIYVPHLSLMKPTIPQPYHVEIWCEKSTMNDILMPLGQHYGINIITGAGELSHTQCVALVARAEASERPVRILYVSDFDPAGASMPVAVARKIEYVLYAEGQRHLDIQVRPVALTHEQCIEYRLPRTPLKETEQRAARFEARFGEGATELDALEALRPGKLERILTDEIGRYYDDTLDERIAEAACGVEAKIADINADVHARHADSLAALESERKKVAAAIAAFEKRARPILEEIKQDLADEAPDVEDIDWPEAEEGDDDDDPLFDSKRDYVDQIARYKVHQGKSVEKAERKKPTRHALTCVRCGKSFMAGRQDARACSRGCQTALLRMRDK
jgi:hypothetical protein